MPLIANSEFSTLPPKYRDDARATAATRKVHPHLG